VEHFAFILCTYYNYYKKLNQYFYKIVNSRLFIYYFTIT